MARNERYGFRDAAYSQWHRADSIKRFIGEEEAENLSQIDIDVTLWAEFRSELSQYHPLGFIETTQDTGNAKCYRVTQNIARISNLPGVLAYYSLSDEPNPINPEVQDIARFRIQRLWPEPENEALIMSPKEWANRLLKIRKWGLARWQDFLRHQK